MSGFAPLSAGTVVLGLLLLAAWLFVLVWLSGRMLRIVARGTGWAASGWRTVLLAFVILLAAIHFGNWLVTVLGDGLRGDPLGWPGFPPAFLIGSVAIGVGVAAVRARHHG